MQALKDFTLVTFYASAIGSVMFLIANWFWAVGIRLYNEEFIGALLCFTFPPIGLVAGLLDTVPLLIQLLP